ITELVRHTVAEELYLCPAVREHLPGGDDLAARELADHAAMERTLRRLERTEVRAERFLPLLNSLVRDAEAHFRAEEDVLFPLLGGSTARGDLRPRGALTRRRRPLPPPPPPEGTSLVAHVRRRAARTAQR